jgi:hypothetical protein
MSIDRQRLGKHIPACMNVFARSNTEIVVSNPTRGIDVCIVCVYSAYVLGSGLSTG